MQGYVCYIPQEVQHMPKRQLANDQRLDKDEYKVQGKRLRSQNSRPELQVCWGSFQKQSNQDLLQQEPEASADENLSGILLYQLHHSPH